MVNVHMKLPKVVQSMLQDKNVLYIVAFLAIVNFFGYIVLRDSYALLIFLSVGFISTYFSKNMTIVLITTLILTNFITVISRSIVVSGKEGFDAAAETKTPPADTTDAEPGADVATATSAPPAKPATTTTATTKTTTTPTVKPATTTTTTTATPTTPTVRPAPSGITGAGLGSKPLKKVTSSDVDLI